MSEIVDKIRSRGYWETTIRPEPFVGDRIPYTALDDVLVRAAVRLRGWPVPYIHPGEFYRGDRWIGADIDASTVDHYEAWRFFESGQFNQIRGISADWETAQGRTRVPQGFDAVVEVWEILYYLTEVIELAARLSLTNAGDTQMTISVKLTGLRSRGLVMGFPHYEVAGFPVPLKTEAAVLERSETIKRDQLLADTRGIAAEWARQFFARFGWQPDVHLLTQLRRRLDSVGG